MTKQMFKDYVDESLNRNKDFLIVKRYTEGVAGAETTIVSGESIGRKIKHYEKAYDDNMVLIKSKESGKIVRITDVLMTNNLHDIAWFAY